MAIRTLKQDIEELENAVTNFVNGVIKTIDKYINKIKA